MDGGKVYGEKKQTLFLWAYFSNKLCVNWVSNNGKSCSSILKVQGQTLSESFMHFHKLFPKPLVCFLGVMCSCLTGNLHTWDPVQLPVMITLYCLLPSFPLSCLVSQPTHTDKTVDFPRFSSHIHIWWSCFVAEYPDWPGRQMWCAWWCRLCVWCETLSPLTHVYVREPSNLAHFLHYGDSALTNEIKQECIYVIAKSSSYNFHCICSFKMFDAGMWILTVLGLFFC